MSTTYTIRHSANFFASLINFHKNCYHDFNGCFNVYGEYIILQLMPVPNDTGMTFTMKVIRKDCDELPVEYSVHILDSAGKKVHSLAFSEVFNDQHMEGDPFLFIKWDKIEKETSKLLHKGTLIVFCEIRIMELEAKQADLLNQRINDTTKVLHLNRKKLLKSKQLTRNAKHAVVDMGIRGNSYAKFLKSGEYSDAVLVARDGVKFPVHKLILTSQSPVFAEQLAEQSQLVFQDMNSAVLQKLLSFIYTGKMEEWKDAIGTMLKLADKYQLATLKAKCERHIPSQLNSANVCETLLIAESEILIGCCIKFIGKHAATVMETEGWKSLIESYPDFAKDFNIKAVPFPML